MFVKKFEGETLDEAIQAVKRELGPDAIILKTVTNKGLKGAFKKNRIEITAAISEQSYEKKARVDHVLSDEQRDAFYREPASSVNKSIRSYNLNQTASANSTTVTKGGAGYGSMGLNRVVKSVSKASNKIKSGLDDFLAAPVETVQPTKPEFEGYSQSNLINEAFSDYEQEETFSHVNHAHVNHTVEVQAPLSSASTEIALELRQQLKSQENKIELLEKKLFELTQNITVKESYNSEHIGVNSLRTTLKTLDLSDKIISDIVKKAAFELNQDDLDNADIVYDFALRELSSSINTAMPLFSSVDVQDKPVVTVLLSEVACGQNSMALKLAVLKEDVKIIKLRSNTVDQAPSDFTSQVFKLDIANVDSLAHLMSEARRAIADKKSLILDIKTSAKDKDESRKIIETLKRSFEHVEFLVTVSAINSELYNRKILSKYKDFADGVIISYMDQCLNFGSILNVHYANLNIPLKFFGIGATVPDDIEAATSERILAGMFEF